MAFFSFKSFIFLLYKTHFDVFKHSSIIIFLNNFFGFPSKFLQIHVFITLPEQLHILTLNYRLINLIQIDYI